MGTIATLAINIIGNTQGLEAALGKAQQSLKSAGDSLTNLGGKLSMGVTAPIVGIGAMAIDSAADFEQSMNVMAQVSGATASQMAALQAQALNLGAVTSFSAGEAAEAQLELAKAGLNANEVMAAAPGVLDLAAAGGLGLAQAAEIAANAVNTFGLDASSTTGIANMLAAAANASSVEVTDLADGMKMAGAVFASAGQSIDDLNIAMALLGNNGIKGSDAGTSLKTALMRLTAPTGEASAALDNLGVKVYDAQGNMRAFPAILADLQQAMYGTNEVTVTHSNLTGEQTARMEYLQKTIASTQTKLANYASGVTGAGQSAQASAAAQDKLRQTLAAAQAEYSKLASVGGTTSTVMKTLTEEERQQALATIFGADAIRSVSVLMAEGTEGWNEMAGALGVAGAATSVANARMSGMRGAVEYLKGSIDSFLIGAALPFLDFLGGLVRGLADAITWVGQLPEPMRSTAIAVAAVAAAIGPTLVGLGMFLKFAAFLMPALSALASVLGLIVSPLGLVAAGIAALIAFDVGGIRTTLGNLANYLLLAATDGDYLNDFLSSLPAGIRPAAMALGELAGAFGNLVQSGDFGAFANDLGAVVQSIGEIDWGGVLGAMGDGFNALRDGVMAALQAVDWGGALTAAGGWLDGLTGGVGAALGGIDWAGALTTAAGWLDILGAGVAAAIQGFGWGGALAATGDLFGGLEAAVADALRGLGFDGAADALDGLAAALSNLPSATTVAQAAIGTINAAIYSAKGALDAAATAVGAFLATGAWATAQTDITTALGAIGAAVAGAFTGEVSLSELRDSLVAQFGEMQTALSGLFASEEWAALGSSLLAAFGLEGLAADIATKVETVKAAFQPLVDFLEPAFTRLAGTVGGLPAQFDELSAKFEPLKAAAGELAAALGGLFGGGEGGGAGAGVILGAALAGTLSLLTNTINGVVGALLPLGGAFIDEVTTLLSGLATVATGLGTAFQGIVANDPSLTLQGLSTAFQGVKDIVTGTFENSLTAVQAALAAIGEIVTTTLSDWGFGAAATAVETLVANVTSLLEKIKAISAGDLSISFTAPDWITKLLAWVWPGLDVPAWVGVLLAWEWPGMTLPEILDGLLAWKWPNFIALPGWVSGLMDWEWPSFDMPDWLNNLFAFKWPSLPELPWWLGGENKAVGTSYFSGGFVNASETSPEVAILPRGVSWLPRGTQILNGRESEGLLAGAGAGGGVTVIIQQASFRNERDMQRFAYEVDDVLQRRRRGG